MTTTTTMDDIHPVSERFLRWTMPRYLRESIEPLLLLNSTTGSVRITKTAVDIQVVDRARRCAIERRFVVDVDFTVHSTVRDAETSRPAVLASIVTGNNKTAGNKTIVPVPKPKKAAAAVPDDDLLFIGGVDIGHLYDALFAVAGNSTVAGTDASTSTKSNDATVAVRPADAEFRAAKSVSSIAGDSKTAADEPVGKQPAIIPRESVILWRVSRRALGVQISNRPVTPSPNDKIIDAAWTTVPVLPAGVVKPVDRPADWIAGAAAEHDGWTTAATTTAMNNNNAVVSVPENRRIRLLPPIGLRLDDNQSWPPKPDWSSTTTYAKVSMRFAPDLQDDLLHLAVVSNRCDILVTRSYVQLTAQYRSGKNGLSVRYHTATGPVVSAAVDSRSDTAKIDDEPQSGKKKKHKTALPVPVVLRTIANKRLVPRLTIDIQNDSSSSSEIKIETDFALRGLRVLHRLVGSSARIEWLVANGLPPQILFYVGVGPIERVVAVMVAASVMS